MPLRTVSPAEARRLIADGATLVDVREPDEHARERIPGARHLPLSQLDDADLAVHQGKPVIFHCRSGARTLANAPASPPGSAPPAKPCWSRVGWTPGRRRGCR